MDFHTGFFCVAYGRDMPSPHVRGEYLPCFLSKMEADGSSPRAWGILRFHPAPVLQGRFIPTCVGNTSFSMGSARLLSVHPHVRGEYLHSAMGKKRPRGSSPRAWGIPSKSAKKLTMCRFIPTCVGNTRIKWRDNEGGPVHPHVRGEYEQRSKVLLDFIGSSPRAWGILCARIL